MTDAAPVVLPDPEVELNLASAVIASSHTPLVLLDDVSNVLAASRSFSRAFGLHPNQINGRPLASLGAGEWALPQLSSLLRATAAGSAQIEAYEFDLKRTGPGGPPRRPECAETRLSRPGPRQASRRGRRRHRGARQRKAQGRPAARKPCCCRSCSTGSPTACRSSPAFCCKAPKTGAIGRNPKPPLRRTQPGDVGGDAAKAARGSRRPT